MSILENPIDQNLFPLGQSMGATFSSPWILLSKDSVFSIQAVWTGSPVGTLTLEQSCDPSSLVTAPSAGSIVTYPGSSAAVSAAGQQTWNFNNARVSFNWIRMTYTFTSGSGSLNSLIFNGY